MAWPEFPLALSDKFRLVLVLALARLVLVLALASMTAGCFQPLYGERTTVGGIGVVDKMRAVEVAPVVVAQRGRLSRVGIEIRNETIYGLTGGGNANTADYRLVITIGSTLLAVVIDPTTGRNDTQNYGIEASYQLIEVGTGKAVFGATTFSRVTYDMPGEQQRFAFDRALRDAETRAAKEIAENIRSRLASYFTAGT